jgi:hypothetical protein
MTKLNKIGMALTVMHASLYAWNSTTSEVTAPVSFPLNSDQQWYTKESYLFWKPFQADIDYGAKSNVTESFIPPPNLMDIINTDVKTKKPKFDWNSGVRIAVGRYLSNHDSWDISLIGTYFYGDGSDKSHVIPEGENAFSPLFFPQDLFEEFIAPTSNRVSWHLNYYTTDLVFGREFPMTPHLTVHPYFGIRAGFIYQDYLNRGDGTFIDQPDGEIEFVQYRNHLKNNFWGAGPRVGADFAFQIDSHWSILGNFAAAFLWGQTSVKEKLVADEILTLIGLSVTDTPLSFRLRDKDQVVRTNLEGSFGFGWEQWVNDHKVRLNPSLVFEGSVWFSMNEIPQLMQEVFTTPPVFETVRRHGDLGLIGATLNFQVDF